MKTNITLFLIATLILSAVSIVAMLSNNNTSTDTTQCRILSDIKPADFNATMVPEKTRESTICGIFGDIKPMDWDEWLAKKAASTTESLTSNPVCGIFGDIKPMDWDDWFEGNDPSNG